MAILNNTTIEGNTRVNGLLSTSSLVLNGTTVTLASGVSDNNGNLVTAAQVKSYITSQAVTPSRTGNTVSWGTGWVTADSSTGDTTSLSKGNGSITSNSNVTLTTTDNGMKVTGSGSVSVGTGWITSGSQTSNSASKYISAITVPSSKTLEITLSGSLLIDSHWTVSKSSNDLTFTYA